jgi:hypothetical protein
MSKKREQYKGLPTRTIELIADGCSEQWAYVIIGPPPTVMVISDVIEDYIRSKGSPIMDITDDK